MAGRTVNSAANVNGVFSSLNNETGTQLHSLRTEFDSTSQWLTDIFTNCKRKLYDIYDDELKLQSQDDRDPKKTKVLQDIRKSITSSISEVEKENCHPNKVTFEKHLSSTSKKDEVEILKSSAKEKTVIEKRRMSHPDDKLDVSSMKVVQLRKELRRRDLTTAGLKKDLQKRLQNHLDEARKIREENNRDLHEKKAEKEAKKEAEQKAKEKEQAERMARLKAQKEEEEEKRKAIAEAETKALAESKARIKEEEAEANAKRAQEEIEAQAKEARAMEQAEVDQMFQQQANEFISQDDEICEMDIDDDDVKRTSGSISNESINQNEIQTENTSSSNEKETDIERMEIETTDQSDLQSQTLTNVSSVDQSTFTSGIKSPRSPTKMVNKFGKKLIKATTKIFSPSKKKDNSPLKQRADAASTRSDDEFVRGQGQRKHGSQVGVIPSTQTIKSDPGMSSQIAAKSQKAQHIISFINKKESTGSISTLGASAATYSVKSTISSYSAISEPLSAQKILERKKALAEARRNRLAEIRGKAISQTKIKSNTSGSDAAAVRQAALMSSAKKVNADFLKKQRAIANAAVNSALKSSTIESSKEEDRKKILAAQMREKAAASNRKQNESAQRIQMQHSVEQTNTKATTSKPLSPLKEEYELAKKIALAQQNAKTLSPMQTYEMSDREDSESDESDYEDDKPKKKIPIWAQKGNLLKALERQFLPGPDRIDPDELFPQVSTCDLEAIFDQKKKRYAHRTSSGNWTKDSVSAAEKLVYKRTLGFDKRK